MKQNSKMVRGIDAIRAAQNGAILYVFNDQRGWVMSAPGTLERAKRMPEQSLHIFGVKRADAKSAFRTCYAQ